MKKLNPSKVLAVLGILYALWVIYNHLIYPVFTYFFIDNDLTGLYFRTLHMMPLTSLPAMFLLYFSIRLFFEKNNKFIKGTVGLVVIFAAIRFVVPFHFMLGEYDLGTSLSEFIATLLAIPVYIISAKLLLRWEGLNSKKGDFIGRGIILWIAYLLYSTGMQLNIKIFPIMDGDEIVDHFPLQFLVFILTILLPILFYRIATRRIDTCREEYLKETFGENAVKLR